MFMKSKVNSRISWFRHFVSLVYHLPGKEGAWFAIRIHCNLKNKKKIEPMLSYHDTIFLILDNHATNN